MVLKLYRGNTCIRTIYNVHKITQGDLGTLIVVNMVNHELFTTTWKFNKHYHRFIITVD